MEINEQPIDYRAAMLRCKLLHSFLTKNRENLKNKGKAGEILDVIMDDIRFAEDCKRNLIRQGKTMYVGAVQHVIVLMKQTHDTIREGYFNV